MILDIDALAADLKSWCQLLAQVRIFDLGLEVQQGKLLQQIGEERVLADDAETIVFVAPVHVITIKAFPTRVGV